jgi:hypothetical protein
MGEIQNRCVFIFFGMTFFVTIQSGDWWCLQSVMSNFGLHNEIILPLMDQNVFHIKCCFNFMKRDSII